MTIQFEEENKRCYVLLGYAPKGTSHEEARRALNDFIAEQKRGQVLFHDHFKDVAGGLAVFAIDTPEAWTALHETGPLSEWLVRLHPLVFSDSTQDFLAQIDFTMRPYRNQRLMELMVDYASAQKRITPEPRLIIT